MQRAPAAVAFLSPVDWKALKLPSYPKIIKQPMDLGTVENKLMGGKYATVSEFKEQVNLIWDNAHLFNEEGSDIYDSATQLRLDFEQRMRSVPDGPLREGGGSSSGGASAGLSSDDLAHCKAILKELKKKHEAEAFLTPVDWKALGIPDYPTIIKRPMDLGTVMQQLDAGNYTSVRKVADDVDLVWTNAMTYNMDGSPIYAAAAKLKARFRTDMSWRESACGLVLSSNATACPRAAQRARVGASGHVVGSMRRSAHVQRQPALARAP
eukprot:6211483-Pleurochrysis_carterae.AAC.2